MKTCFKCNVSQPIEEFYRHKAMADGYLGKCKTCAKLDTAEARLKKIDHYRQYDRNRASMPHRKELHARVGAEWRAEHPKRRNAQVMLGNAVRRGEIAPQPCLLCGRKAEAHHPNYDAPLDVVWLCSPHHKQAHALGRRIDKGEA